MMNEFQWICLALIGVMAIDAIGDGLRMRGRQVMHHMAEVVGVALWFVIWFSMDVSGRFFDIIWMYVLIRIALFDVIVNLVAGQRVSYVGKSSLYERLLTQFSSWLREPGMLIWVLRVIALVWWVAWFIVG